MRSILLIVMIWLMLFPGALLGFGDKATKGDCSPIITGDIKAPIKIECGKASEIPIQALAKLEIYLQESYRSQKNLNDLIDKLRTEVTGWEQKYKDALVQNTTDRKKNPGNSQLEKEQQALQAGELEKAAQIREAYYQDLKQAKTAELAKEAYVAAERWEGAFKLARALELYQEAVMFRRNYPEAWRSINRIAKRLGDYDVALEAAQNLQKQLDPEKDAWWFAVALIDEADILSAFGHNQKANDQYQKSYGLLVRLAKTEPNNHQLARDLSVSYDRVGDMHLKTGDNVAALKAYQDGLAIAKKLAELDPNHTEWQRDLSVSYDRVGDMHLKTGDNVAALKAYQESLAIRKKLAELDPNVVEWQTDLVVSYFKLAQIQENAQKQLLQDALDILSRLHREKRLDHEKQRWIGILQESLQQIAAE